MPSGIVNKVKIACLYLIAGAFGIGISSVFVLRLARAVFTRSISAIRGRQSSGDASKDEEESLMESERSVEIDIEERESSVESYDYALVHRQGVVNDNDAQNDVLIDEGNVRLCDYAMVHRHGAVNDNGCHKDDECHVGLCDNVLVHRQGVVNDNIGSRNDVLNDEANVKWKDSVRNAVVFQQQNDRDTPQGMIVENAVVHQHDAVSDNIGSCNDVLNDKVNVKSNVEWRDSVTSAVLFQHPSSGNSDSPQVIKVENDSASNVKTGSAEGKAMSNVELSGCVTNSVLFQHQNKLQDNDTCKGFKVKNNSASSEEKGSGAESGFNYNVQSDCESSIGQRSVESNKQSSRENNTESAVEKSFSSASSTNLITRKSDLEQCKTDAELSFASSMGEDVNACSKMEATFDDVNISKGYSENNCMSIIREIKEFDKKVLNDSLLLSDIMVSSEESNYTDSLQNSAANAAGNTEQNSAANSAEIKEQNIAANSAEINEQNSTANSAEINGQNSAANSAEINEQNKKSEVSSLDANLAVRELCPNSTKDDVNRGMFFCSIKSETSGIIEKVEVDTEHSSCGSMCDKFGVALVNGDTAKDSGGIKQDKQNDHLSSSETELILCSDGLNNNGQVRDEVRFSPHSDDKHIVHHSTPTDYREHSLSGANDVSFSDFIESTIEKVSGCKINLYSYMSKEEEKVEGDKIEKLNGCCGMLPTNSDMFLTASEDFKNIDGQGYDVKSSCNALGLSDQSKPLIGNEDVNLNHDSINSVESIERKYSEQKGSREMDFVGLCCDENLMVNLGVDSSHLSVDKINATDVSHVIQVTKERRQARDSSVPSLEDLLQSLKAIPPPIDDLDEPLNIIENCQDYNLVQSLKSCNQNHLPNIECVDEPQLSICSLEQPVGNDCRLLIDPVGLEAVLSKPMSNLQQPQADYQQPLSLMGDLSQPSLHHTDTSDVPNSYDESGEVVEIHSMPESFNLMACISDPSLEYDSLIQSRSQSQRSMSVSYENSSRISEEMSLMSAVSSFASVPEVVLKMEEMEGDIDSVKTEMDEMVNSITDLVGRRSDYNAYVLSTCPPWVEKNLNNSSDLTNISSNILDSSSLVSDADSDSCYRAKPYSSSLVPDAETFSRYREPFNILDSSSSNAVNRYMVNKSDPNALFSDPFSSYPVIADPVSTGESSKAVGENSSEISFHSMSPMLSDGVVDDDKQNIRANVKGSCEVFTSSDDSFKSSEDLLVKSSNEIMMTSGTCNKITTGQHSSNVLFEDGAAIMTGQAETIDTNKNGNVMKVDSEKPEGDRLNGSIVGDSVINKDSDTLKRFNDNIVGDCKINGSSTGLIGEKCTILDNAHKVELNDKNVCNDNYSSVNHSDEINFNQQHTPESQAREGYKLSDDNRDNIMSLITGAYGGLLCDTELDYVEKLLRDLNPGTGESNADSLLLSPDVDVFDEEDLKSSTKEKSGKRKENDLQMERVSREELE